MIKIGNTYILHDGEEVHEKLSMREIARSTNIITIAKNSSAEEVVVIHKLKYRQLALPIGNHLIIKTLIPKSTT